MSELGDLEPATIRRLLQQRGLTIDLGSGTFAVRGPVSGLADDLTRLYRHFPLESEHGFVDIRIDMHRPAGWRRWVRPQVVLRCDGETPFEPFPRDHALPLLEWGVNWFIGQRINHQLLFHAACLERDGFGLLLPAVPGSGKSTLAVALAHRGWRLLSDEFGVLDMHDRQLRAMLKPAALKNESIDVIRRTIPEARIGRLFPRTRKGTVAHVAADRSTVARRHEAARPALVVMPQWRAGVSTTLAPVGREELFRALAFNSFNYDLLGEAAFEAVIALSSQCLAFRLEYSDLIDAIACLDDVWSRQAVPLQRVSSE